MFFFSRRSSSFSVVQKSAKSLAFCVVLSSCGSSSNLNQIWGDDQGADGYLSKAKTYYDKGEYSAAEKELKNILSINPLQEEASVLLGYVYLSQGGLDPFRVASCLINLEDTTGSSRCKKASGSAALRPETLALEESWDLLMTQKTSGTKDTSSSSSDVSDTLRKLQDGLLSLSKADYETLKKKDFEGSSDLFKDSNKLIVPKEVTEELRNAVYVLNKMNGAIRSICHLVDDTPDMRPLKSRYPESCKTMEGPRKNASKAHYLWAISHLTEALVFQSVLLYDTSDKYASNIQAASEMINTKNFGTDVTAYLTSVVDLKNAVDSIFDTGTPTSMISETLNSLTATNEGFAALSGLPQSMRAQLTKIIDNIRSISKTIGGDVSTKNQTRALKSQMTEKFSQTVGDKSKQIITKLAQAKDPNATETSVTPEFVKKLSESEQKQVKTICSTYDSLASDLTSDKKLKAKPTACE